VLLTNRPSLAVSRPLPLHITRPTVQDGGVSNLPAEHFVDRGPAQVVVEGDAQRIEDEGLLNEGR